MIEFFVGALTLFLALLLTWAFKSLPAEKWQFVATIPTNRNSDGHWTGLNLTFYGALTALGYVMSIFLLIMMCAAVGVAMMPLIGLVAVLLITIVPSSRWVARWVEGKQHTFTVAGAVFVAALVCPLATFICNFVLIHLGMTAMPTLPLLAAMAISYTLGEGVGRIACISFGCCYGKPVSTTAGLHRRLFQRLNFVFEGHTKKIAYEGQLSGVPVIPIQAMTSTLYITTAVIGLWLFMHGWYTTALVVTLAITQLWRVYSEFLRADYRGDGSVSPYQFMAVATLLIGVVYAFVYRGTFAHVPDLARGLHALWAPEPLIALQILGLVIFFYTGRSEVTESRLQIRVCAEKI